MEGNGSQYKPFIENDATIAGFNGANAKPAHRVFLNVDLARKVAPIEFFVIDSEASQNG